VGIGADRPGSPGELRVRNCRSDGSLHLGQGLFVEHVCLRMRSGTGAGRFRPFARREIVERERSGQRKRLRQLGASVVGKHRPACTGPGWGIEDIGYQPSASDNRPLDHSWLDAKKRLPEHRSPVCPFSPLGL